MMTDYEMGKKLVRLSKQISTLSESFEYVGESLQSQEIPDEVASWVIIRVADEFEVFSQYLRELVQPSYPHS